MDDDDLISEQRLREQLKDRKQKLIAKIVLIIILLLTISASIAIVLNGHLSDPSNGSSD